MLDMIVAVSKNNVIGVDNKLPWDLKEDLKYFKEITSGHMVLMGRNTYQSIGKPLPNRKNVVLTRDDSFKPEGVTVVHSIESAISEIAMEEASEVLDKKQVFIIGGAEIYKQFMPYVRRLYITMIDIEIEGDTFFPEYKDHFKMVSCSEEKEENGITYRFTIWDKV